MIRKYTQYAPIPRKSKLKQYIVWFVVLLLSILVAQLLFEPIMFVLKKLFIGLMPFFIALLIVYMLKQPRKLIANKLLKNAFSRAQNPQKWRMTIALIVVFVLFLALLVGIFWLIVPKITSIIENVITNSDAYVNKLKQQLVSILDNMPYLQNFINENTIDAHLDKLMQSLQNYQSDLPSLISSVGSKLLNFFNLLLIGLIFAFLILLNIDKYKQAILDTYSAYKSPTKVYRITDFIHKADKIFVDYGFSKLIEGIIILLSVTIGLIISGSQMPFELAIFMALLNVIPYIGPIIALAPILLVNLVLGTASVAFISALVAILIVIFVTSFITPLIVGKKIKIDIFTVLLSLTIGGALFGAIGMIFAPPVVAIILYSIKNAVNNKKIKDNNL